MHGHRRNLILLSIYVVLAFSLLFSLVYFIWHSTTEKTNPQNFPLHQLEKYFITATVQQVHVTARALVVDYQTSTGVIVGLLPEAKLYDKNKKEIALNDLTVGSRVRIEVKFIGTNSILAGNIYLVD